MKNFFLFRFIDGGLVNPVPVSLCRALGADVVIAVNLHKNVIVKSIPEKLESKSFESTYLSNLLAPLPKSIQDTAEAVSEYISKTAETFSKSNKKIVAPAAPEVIVEDATTTAPHIINVRYW